jgi:hypothetical protein
MVDSHGVQSLADRRVVEKRLEAVSWGLFFVWIGVALLSNFGWAIGLLGVGVIILGTQITRKPLALKVDKFWAVVGSLFILGGIWEWFKIQVGLVPILCIAVGLALLVSAMVRKPTG